MNTDTDTVQAANLTGSNLADDPHESAAQTGQVVILPGARDLFIDIDNDEDRRTVYEMVGVLAKNGLEFEVLSDKPSKSGLPHRHVYVRAPRDLTPVERIALQACLGSDRRREVLSLLRVWTTERPPTVFFEAPGFVKPEPAEDTP